MHRNAPAADAVGVESVGVSEASVSTGAARREV
jgi:hypothetical protein